MLSFWYSFFVAAVVFLVTSCDGEPGRREEEGPDSVTATDESVETDEDTEDTCRFPRLAECSQTSPTPKTRDEIIEFISQNAVPFNCASHGQVHSNLGFIADRFAGKRMLMLGEVHGSKEIGIASSAIAAYLAENGMIDALAMEIPMDVTAAIQAYIETGSPEQLGAYGFDDWSTSMFWRTLPEMARELSLNGVELDVFGVDFPFELAWVNDQLQKMANQMGPEAAGIVLEDMPPDKEIGEQVDFAFAELVLAYKTKLEKNAGILCADIGDVACTNLMSLARGYLLGALNSWPDFWDSGAKNIDAFMAERELLLRDNISVKFQGGTKAMFAHLGTMHVAKREGALAGYLDRDDPIVAGSLYSLSAGYGPGSEVLFHGSVQKLDPEPAIVAEALKDAEWTEYVVMVEHPGIDCRENPLAAQVSSVTNSPLSVFNALLWFRTVSPEEMTAGKSLFAGRRLRAVFDRWERMVNLNESFMRHAALPIPQSRSLTMDAICAAKNSDAE